MDYINLDSARLRNQLTSKREEGEYCYSTQNSKAPGIDGIEPIVVHNLSKLGVAHFTEISNACLRLQYYPVSFKRVMIVPIHKGRGKWLNDPKSYRQVSLLGILAKVLDKIIQSRLAGIVEERRLIPEEEFEFRSGRSTRIGSSTTLKRNPKKG